MRHKIITLALLLPLLLTGCSKDYFSELRHPLEIQGAFDPVYGFPLAKLSANLATFVGMVDSNQAISVFIGEDDIISLQYEYTQHAVITQTSGKSISAKGDAKSSDTLHFFKPITGSEPIDVFEQLQNYDTNSFRVNEFLINLDADIQAYVNSSFETVMAEGVNLSFDSIYVTISCIDGYSESIPIIDTIDDISATELINRTHVPILKNYNIRKVVEHKPSQIDYALRVCIDMPVDQLAPGSTLQDELDKIGMDSIITDIYARVEVPMSFYSNNLRYVDTIDLDLSNLSEDLQNINQGTLTGENYTLQLNDSNCYLGFVVNNGLPIGLNFDVTFIDQYNTPVLSTIFEGDFIMEPSPVMPLAGHPNTYVSNGMTPSQFKLKLSLDDISKLSGTRKLIYDITLNTSNSGLPSAIPFISLRNSDRLELRTYIVLSPHAEFVIPINSNSK